MLVCGYVVDYEIVLIVEVVFYVVEDEVVFGGCVIVVVDVVEY